MMHHSLSFVFIFFSSVLFAQTDSLLSDFDYQVAEVLGDLNKDNLPDKVVVEQDTTAFTWPYRIQVFFGQPNGSFQLIALSEQLIAAQYPNGREGYRDGIGFSEIDIKKNVLTVKHELLRGHFEYKFRYQNGHVELIGYSYVSSNGLGQFTVIDFNLSTGIRLYKRENYETDEILENTKEKRLIRPLPKLEDITPFNEDWNY